MTSTAPPPPPKSGGSLGYLVAAGLMAIAIAGLLYWKLGAKKEEPPAKAAPSPKVEEQKEEVTFTEPPPPPPPEEELAEEEKKATAEKPKAKKSTGGGACAQPCEGTLTVQGQQALAAKGGQARNCYQRALRQNSTLSGKMMVAITVSSTGQACSASITQDALGDHTVSNCVVQMFRSGKYPAPQGGCVNAQVPLNFTPAQ